MKTKRPTCQHASYTAAALLLTSISLPAADDTLGTLTIEDEIILRDTALGVPYTRLFFEESFNLLEGNTLFSWQSQNGGWSWGYGIDTTSMHLSDNHILSLYNTDDNAAAIVLDPGNGTTPASIKVDGNEVLTTATAPTFLSDQYIPHLGNGSSDSLLLQGTYGGTGAIPAEGTGSRMMWYPEKAAFRAGYAAGGGWDEANVGLMSTAFGSATLASGHYSTAMGYDSKAIGHYSLATGYKSEATGIYATAMGFFSAASNYSIATGSHTTASGTTSTAMGSHTTASGTASTSLGNMTTASGDHSTAMGYQTEAEGDYSTAMGRGAEAIGMQSTAMGFGSRASGVASTAMGYDSKAIGHYSLATGYKSEATGIYATAMGFFSAASNYSIATGSHTTASGTTSTAMGSHTTASGLASTSLGNDTTASGNNSTSMGLQTNAGAYASLAAGYLNENRVSLDGATAWRGNALNSVLEIGIGTSNTDRKNALTVLQDGSVEIGKATATDNSVPLKISADGSVILAKAQGDISMGIFAE